MKLILPAASLLLLAASGPREDKGRASCGYALEASTICFSTEKGVVVSTDIDRAKTLASHTNKAARRFKTIFGRAAGRYAVIDRLNIEDDPQWREFVRAQMVEAIVALPAKLLKMEGLRDPFGANSDRSNELRDIAGRKDRLDQHAAPNIKDSFDYSNFASHELGHEWFKAICPRTDARDYGTSAPDWVDEAAAMLMEDEKGAQGSRREFSSAYRGIISGGDFEAIGAELDLKSIVEAKHPLSALKIKIPDGANVQGSSFQVVTLQESSNFYPKVRVLIDYLKERSGSHRAFGRLAASSCRTSTMDVWLSKNGRKFNLPGSIREMERDWRSWLIANYGAPRAASTQ